MTTGYFLKTGDADRERLTILNSLYNPPALRFLQDSGLRPGMTLLEIGCGTGHMACDIASYLGPAGKVIATDSSEAQIQVAKATARSRGIVNIDFLQCDVMELDKLGINYDATYGRWVVEFTRNPKGALAAMYSGLNPGGLLAYEASNMKQTAYFTSPHHTVIDQWFSYGPKMFAAYGYPLKFGEEAYQVFKQLGCHDIKIKPNQAILISPKEKSVYRLGTLSSGPSLVEKGLATEKELADLINALAAFEQTDSISGFYQNMLVSGIKT